VQAFGEGVVLTRVADEAGVELEGLIEQRGQVVNQRVREATATEKGQGERLGSCKGYIVEGTSA
jgi:hypothetical protein